MITTKRFRVGHVETEKEACAAAGVPQIGERGPLGVVISQEAKPSSLAGFVVLVTYENAAREPEQPVVVEHAEAIPDGIAPNE